MPRPAEHGAVRPTDAAGLVLIREIDGELAVLMGRRHGRASFMPHVYVFPGGRLERGDARPTGLAEPAVPGAVRGLDGRSRRLLPALTRAAVRETHEETGLLFGRPARAPGQRPTAPTWCAFARAGLAPAFADMNLLARAITPTGMPMRFHTRFFLGDGRLASGPFAGDGELEDLGWRSVDAAAGLPIADVTAFVLDEAVARWRGGRSDGVPLYCYVRDGPLVRRA